MFEPDQLPALRELIRARTHADAGLLSEVLADVAALRSAAVTIQPRDTTSVSLVASDGGNNRIDFNPFSLQMIRVVDSYGDELFLDVVSPSTDIRSLSRAHLDESGPRTPLGRLMADLGTATLSELSPMLPEELSSPSWVLVYRDLCEWAILYDLICYQRFSTDTLIVRDGLLRSKIFTGDLFVQMYRRMIDSIETIARQRRREVYLVGIAKHSEVLSRYSMAMALAGVFPAGHAIYAAIPLPLQAKVYRWKEYIRPPDEVTGEAAMEVPKYNAGAMHFVRFGVRSGDPVWTVDLLHAQKSKAQKILGSLLADAVNGFPIPFYPNCLQQADHHAQVVDLDLDILRDTLVESVREQLAVDKRPVLDALALASDVTGRRYG